MSDTNLRESVEARDGRLVGTRTPDLADPVGPLYPPELSTSARTMFADFQRLISNSRRRASSKVSKRS